MDVGAFETGFSDFVDLALNHGVGSVEGGRPLIPFVLIETNGQRHLRRFALERLEESVDAAFEFASDAQDIRVAAA